MTEYMTTPSQPYSLADEFMPKGPKLRRSVSSAATLQSASDAAGLEAARQAKLANGDTSPYDDGDPTSELGQPGDPQGTVFKPQAPVGDTPSTQDDAARLSWQHEVNQNGNPGGDAYAPQAYIDSWKGMYSAGEATGPYGDMLHRASAASRPGIQASRTAPTGSEAWSVSLPDGATRATAAAPSGIGLTAAILHSIVNRPSAPEPGVYDGSPRYMPPQAPGSAPQETTLTHNIINSIVNRPRAPANSDGGFTDYVPRQAQSADTSPPLTVRNKATGQTFVTTQQQWTQNPAYATSYDIVPSQTQAPQMATLPNSSAAAPATLAPQTTSSTGAPVATARMSTTSSAAAKPPDYSLIDQVLSHRTQVTNGGAGAPVAPLTQVDTSSRQSNLQSWAPALRAVEQKTGLRADALGAIILAENGGGQSPLSAGDNNYFSISAVDGRPYQAGAGAGGRFAHYNTPQDSLNDFVNLISTSPRYAEAWANRGDPQKFFQGLVSGGYIVPEAGFPVETWLKNLDAGRDEFNRAAPPPTTTPMSTSSPAAAPRPQTQDFSPVDSVLASRGRGTAAATAPAGGFNVDDVLNRYTGGAYTFGGGRDSNGIGIPGTKNTDCSGFVSAVEKERGVDLPAHTDAAYAKLQQLGAKKIPPDQAQPGDIVFYMGSGYGGSNSYHMGFYAGPGQILDASRWNGDTGVHVRPMAHAGEDKDIVIMRDPRLAATGGNG